MKKLLCILFCLLFTTLTLVGCGEEDRNEWIDDKDGKYKDYITDTSIPEVALNLYIIVDDETLDTSAGVIIPEDKTGKIGEVTQAINTVNNAIKDFTTTNYHSPVNVIYVKESEYDDVVVNAVNAPNGDAKAANIVLVNSYSLMQRLYETNKLCSLDDYLANTKFARLNTSIPTALLEASKIETVVDGNATKTLYTIPNNHVIGSYEYLLINKEFARALKIQDTEINALTSYDDAVLLFESAMERENYSVDNLSNLLTLTSGSYEDRALYISQGYFCNIVKMPIADKNEAFLSAFAIVDRNTDGSSVDINERAMEIVYNINMNVELRNLLQYGVAGTNYKLDMNDDTVISELLKGPNTYTMNLLYTGNVMNAYVCEEIGWNSTTKANTEEQNKDSVTVADSKQNSNSAVN